MPPRLVHDLQVYLALGVTSFVSLTYHLEDMQRLQRDIAAGFMRSPRVYISGPGITAPHGHPSELFTFMPGFAEYMTRQASTPEAAAQAVRELTVARVDIIKLFLEDGWSGQTFPVLPEAAFRAAIRTANEIGFRTTVHVDNDQHARLAIDAGQFADRYNALDAMTENGADSVRRLSVRTACDPEGVLVEIGDTGRSGIPKEIREKIFDPFFTTKGVGEGTGLGLDIIRRVMQKYRADIRLESTPGDTRFQVRLPLNRPR